MSIKTFHITVNGVPFCKSDLTLTDELTKTRCQHFDVELAQRGAELCRQHLPGQSVEIVEGPCPRSGQMTEED